MHYCRICSIDPLTARDLDDALSIEPLPAGGGRRVGVHIADVAHFVAAGSALDKEAQERGTSVYMVDRVIPMLPRLLCEELCSLNPGESSCRSRWRHAGKIALVLAASGPYPSAKLRIEALLCCKSKEGILLLVYICLVSWFQW